MEEVYKKQMKSAKKGGGNIFEVILGHQMPFREMENVLWQARDFMSGWNVLIEMAGKFTIESRSFRFSM